MKRYSLFRIRQVSITATFVRWIIVLSLDLTLSVCFLVYQHYQIGPMSGRGKKGVSQQWQLGSRSGRGALQVQNGPRCGRGGVNGPIGGRSGHSGGDGVRGRSSGRALCDRRYRSRSARPNQGLLEGTWKKFHKK